MPLVTYATLVLTMLFWGGTFIAGRALAGHVNPANAAFIRFAIATVALLILTRVHDGKIGLPPRNKWISLIILGLTGVFSYNVLFFSGLQYVSAGRAALIIALNPLVITLFARLFLGEQLNIKQLGGIMLSLAGAVLVITNGNPSALFSTSFGKGELAILGCVASWSTYSLVGRTVLTSMTPLASVFYSSLIGTVLLAIPAINGGLIQAIATIRLPGWFSLGYLGFFGTALGFSLYYRAIRKVGPSRAGVFINLVPLFSIILSWLILDESIKPIVILGGIILLTGVSITNLCRKKV